MRAFVPAAVMFVFPAIAAALPPHPGYPKPGTPLASQKGAPNAAQPAIARPHKPKHPHATAVVAATSPLPAPEVTLSIEPSGTDPRWTFRLSNNGSVPVRVFADARLLSFEGRPLGLRHSIVCKLPEPMTASEEEAASLVLPPTRSVSGTFDIREYCFHDAEVALLEPGIQLTAHYAIRDVERLGAKGMAEAAAVQPVEGVTPALAPLPALRATFAAPMKWDETPSPSPALETDAGAATAATESDASVLMSSGGSTANLELRIPQRIDTQTPFDVVVPVTLVNRSARTVYVRFRPETLNFDVVGPNGVEHCEWPANLSGPVREAFDRLGPHGEMTLDVDLGAYCHEHEFDDNGLFVIRAHLDTREASGQPIGIRSFDGELTGGKTSVIRLWAGRSPHPNAPPVLDPLP